MSQANAKALEEWSREAGKTGFGGEAWGFGECTGDWRSISNQVEGANDENKSICHYLSEPAKLRHLSIMFGILLLFIHNKKEKHNRTLLLLQGFIGSGPLGPGSYLAKCVKRNK